MRFGYAACAAATATSSGTGSPMNKASPHCEQPHSGHTPSATSGQLPGSACICSNVRSAVQLAQNLVSWVILATSSRRCDTGVQEIK